jgi:hypothetical protein
MEGEQQGETETEMIDKRVADVIYTLGRETDTPDEVVEAVVRRALPRFASSPSSPGKAKRRG